MTKRLANEIIVGLDIGTSKVLAVVAEVKENQDIEILGVGQHPSRGLRKGVVANIDSTVQSIQQAIEKPHRVWRVSEGDEACMVKGCQ